MALTTTARATVPVQDRTTDDARGSTGAYARPDPGFEDAEVASEVPGAADYAAPGVNPDLVRRYLDEIGRVPLLSAAEEVTLAREIEAGVLAEERIAKNGRADPDYDDLNQLVLIGRAAKRRLTEANLRLVVSVARRYMRRGLTLLDLVQEGNVGLMRAVERFDYTRGFKFSTYATWWIRQAISRALAEQSRTIRLPVHVVDELNRVLRARRAMWQTQTRDPSPEELARLSGIEPERVTELLTFVDEPVSLQAPVGERAEQSFGELVEDTDELSPAEIVTQSMLRDQVLAALSCLNERERRVVRLRFGLDDGRVRTLEEVGRILGVTRERIRQIERRTLNKLRQEKAATALREYLR
ncbi:sigma-70 family RNA polymerase sigma factor [Phytoactinopolyspora halophila]|uniref:sigma-70 family RNA polymerase sigma factor n=1 Tax=Phytoactinopolyspora halophila TaxID=1981511 RepID=UPI001FE39763|nr:sigma-70 family RNA polymerase sigma factor [Phytoactinopolyspora halophila]